MAATKYFVAGVDQLPLIEQGDLTGFGCSCIGQNAHECALPQAKPACKSGDAVEPVEVRSRAAIKDAAGIAVPDGADKIAASARIGGEEFFVDSLVVEPGHRAAIQPNSSGSDHQIGALQGGIAKRAFLASVLVTFEPTFGVGMREQPRQFLVEIDVIAHDSRDGSSLDLVAISI